MSRSGFDLGRAGLRSRLAEQSSEKNTYMHADSYLGALKMMVVKNWRAGESYSYETLVSWPFDFHTDLELKLVLFEECFIAHFFCCIL